MKMRVSKIICFAVGAILAATAACADEISIVSNILGPEGPLYVDGNLYYVGWISNTLSKWDGKTTTVLNHTPGCGHNGLALTKQKTFLLACTEEHGAILELDMTGKQLRRWDADKNGKPFDGGINDIVVTANGGAYATVFGPYADLPTSVVGENSLSCARQPEMGRGSGRTQLRQRHRRLSRSKDPLRQRNRRKLYIEI
jgi:gluconolactonase